MTRLKMYLLAPVALPLKFIPWPISMLTVPGPGVSDADTAAWLTLGSMNNAMSATKISAFAFMNGEPCEPVMHSLVSASVLHFGIYSHLK
jgi:hypothetical protein